jgi:hypothetical protein
MMGTDFMPCETALEAASRRASDGPTIAPPRRCAIRLSRQQATVTVERPAGIANEQHLLGRQPLRDLRRQGVRIDRLALALRSAHDGYHHRQEAFAHALHKTARQADRAAIRASADRAGSHAG